VKMDTVSEKLENGNNHELSEGKKIFNVTSLYFA